MILVNIPDTVVDNMAHEAQQVFCLEVREKYPDAFKNKRVLDCGSLDINGSNRYLFDGCIYLGIDLGPGKNVDRISLIHEFTDPDGFDTVISTECFEHDMYWDKSLRNMIGLLKPGGLLLFTCAAPGRGEHGTKRTSPRDSPFTCEREIWCDYFRPLRVEDISQAIELPNGFASYHIIQQGHDLQFYGVKK
jgi:SAM-dependent methyltransferase